MTLGQLRVALGVDASGLSAGERAVQSFASSVKREMDGLNNVYILGMAKQAKAVDDFSTKASRDLRQLESQAKATANALIDIGRRATVAISVPLGAVATLGIQQAIEAETVARKFTSAFGSEADRVLHVLEEMKAVIPEGTTELQDMSAGLQILQRNMGISATRAEAMTLELLEIANAVDKVQGGGVGNILEAFRAGLAGQTRGLKEFQIVIDDAAVTQEAFRLGILQQGQTLTQAGTALATFSLLQKQTAGVVAAATTTTESAGREFKKMLADLKELAEEIGRRLLPSFLQLGRVIGTIVTVFTQLDPGLENTIIAFGVMAAALGPLIFLIGSVYKTIIVLAGGIRLLTASLVGLNLTPAGAILTGLGLLAAALFFVKGRLDEATRSQDAFRISLIGMTEAEAITGLSNLNRQILDAQQNLTKLPKGAVGDLLGKSIDKALKDLTEKRRLVEAQLLQVQQLRATATDGAGTPGGFSTPLSDLEKLVERTKALASAFDLVAGRAAVPAEILNAIPKVISDANALLAKQKDFLSADAIKLREIVKGMEALQHAALSQSLLSKVGVTPGNGPGISPRLTNVAPDVGAQVAQIEKFAAAILETRNRLEQALAVGSNALAERVQKDLDDLIARARIAGAEVLKALVEGGLSKEDASKLSNALDALVSGVKTPSDSLTKFEKQLQSIQSAGETTLSALASGFTRLDDSISQTIRSTLTLISGLELGSDALKKIKADRAKKDKDGSAGALGLGTIATAVAAVASILGPVQALGQAIFGRSQHEKEVIAALRDNASRISAAALELSGALRGLKGLQSVQTALDPSMVELLKFIERLGTSSGNITDLFNKQLKNLGLTLDEVNAIAQANGIQLLDSKGKVIAGALDQLAEMIDISITALTTWSDSLDDQRERLNIRSLVNNLPDDPAREFMEELSLLPTALSQMFSGINLATEQGREQVRAILNNILDIVDAGKLAEFGITLDDLTSILGPLATNLNELDSATRSLTESMTNVPTGFRIQAARFNAQTPVSAALALPSLANQSVTLASGAIVIQQQPGEDAVSLAQRVVAEMEQRSRRSTGTPTNWAQVS